MLIDEWMPSFDVREHHLIRVEAPAHLTYDMVRGVDLSRSRLIRSLFTARGLPRLIRRVRPSRRTMTLDDLVRAGFVWLADQPPTEIVLGIVGRFWIPRGGVERITAEQFQTYDRDGRAKAAWNFRLIADGDEACIVTTETRVRVPDDESRRSFMLYWAAIGPFSSVVRRQALRLIKAEAERQA